MYLCQMTAELTSCREQAIVATGDRAATERLFTAALSRGPLGGAWKEVSLRSLQPRPDLALC